jgi:AraC-like DNA-binding protein
MGYAIYFPCEELSEIVECYWHCTTMPGKCVKQHYATPLLQGMAFNFLKLHEYHEFDNKKLCLDKVGYIFGQPTSSRLITSDLKGVAIFGVKFKPLGINKVTGINMAHLANKIISLEDIWPNEMDFLYDEMQSALDIMGCIAVLEKFLVQKLLKSRFHYKQEVVEEALSHIQSHKGSLKIDVLQRETYTAKKTLQRAFTECIGITPKLYSRIIRFNHAKVLIEQCQKLDTLDIATQLNYYDQSYFSSEFKQFSGITPTVYFTAFKSKTDSFTIPID